MTLFVTFLAPDDACLCVWIPVSGCPVGGPNLAPEDWISPPDGQNLSRLVHPHNQVLRDSRLRAGQPGSEWSQKDHEVWSEQALTFLRKRRALSAVGAGEEQSRPRKVRKKDIVIPRLASYDNMCCLQHQLTIITGAGLERFCSTGDAASSSAVPPMLILSMDYDGTMWCPFWFMRQHVSLFIEGVPDFTHRRHRDLDLASNESGMRLVLTRGHVCNNAPYGPWQGAGFHRDVSETSQDIAANLMPDDPVLFHFWPSILADLRWGPDFDNSDGRKKFLQELPAVRTFLLKGPKSSASRWCSWQHASAYHDPYWGAEAFVLSFYALKKGWAVDLEDLCCRSATSRSLSSATEEKSTTALVAYPSASSAGHGGATPSSGAGSSSAHPAPKANAKAKAGGAETDKARSTQKVQTERASAKNTLHYVAQCKNDPEHKLMVRLICHVSAAEVEHHSEYTARVLKGRQ